jgi:very-short-patch-repair endonuclease
VEAAPDTTLFAPFAAVASLLMASPQARRLRREPTDAERALWTLLRRKQLDGFRFRRQQPMGPYIVDFFCPSQRLVIELDGGQHDAGLPAEQRRTAWLESRGYRVVRFWNNEVLGNPEGVLEAIRELLACGPPPTPTLPLKGGGG